MHDTRLPVPNPEPGAVLDWVGRHLDGLISGPLRSSGLYRGGQTAADAALAAFDVAGYAERRNTVLPVDARGASGLSPYIRHGLLPLPFVWEAVAGGPDRDVNKFRDELLWQEYARHLYARLGSRTAQPLRFAITQSGPQPQDDGMACVQYVWESLETDGWLVNQTRMWMASHWSIRRGDDWQDGEDWFFRHLLDGSRAANRAGWQWTAGLATGRPYGFSRTQVERQAPELCRRCKLNETCPIQDWAPDPDLQPETRDERLYHDDDPAATAGPSEPVRTGHPDAVWLTAESLGDADPALAAHPDLPAVFVFDEALLSRLRLSAKRLVFLVECLADLTRRRDVVLHRGDPVVALRNRSLAATFTPVPGWRRRSTRLALSAIYPWRWLRPPHAGSLASYSAWRKRI
jgi:deoxyribodipyrimidine photo-lyase